MTYPSQLAHVRALANVLRPKPDLAISVLVKVILVDSDVRDPEMSVAHESWIVGPVRSINQVSPMLSTDS